MTTPTTIPPKPAAAGGGRAFSNEQLYLQLCDFRKDLKRSLEATEDLLGETRKSNKLFREALDRFDQNLGSLERVVKSSERNADSIDALNRMLGEVLTALNIRIGQDASL